MTRETKLGWIVAAVLVAVIPVTAVASSLDETPVSVVEDYLAAVQREDVAEALRISGREGSKTSDPMRAPAAMSSGWRVESVALRAEPEGTEAGDDTPPHLVDAVLSADGLTTRGRFVVTRQEDGDWRIENPYVGLLVDPGPLDFVELNGAVVQAEPGDLDEDSETQGLPVWVFPGLYRPYAENPGVSAETKQILLAPNGQDGVEQSPELDPKVDVTRSGTDAIDEAVREHIDACAARETPALKDCPYLAADKVHGVGIGSKFYDDVTDITWTIDEYPKVIATVGADGFHLVANNDPAATMTAMGRLNGDGPRVEFTATCPIGLSNDDFHEVSPRVTATLDSDGEAAVSWALSEFDTAVLYQCH